MNCSELMNQVEILEKKGEIENAISTCRKIISADSQSAEVYYKLALLLHRSGEISEAITCFQKVVDLDSHDATAWNNLGALFYQQKDLGQAEQAFRKATSCNERYAEAWYGLGKVLLKRECLEQAADAFHQCLRWDPVHEKAKQAFDALNVEIVSKPVKNLRIGFVTIWFERGQSYVTKILRDVLDRDHETFVFARTGGVYNQPMLETEGFWDVPNLTTYQQYQIDPQTLIQWINENGLDAVVFNEEYDWNLVRAAKSTGCRVLAYLDYYKEDWKPFMKMYDAVLCSTLRTFYLVKDFCNAYYIGWAVDTDLFSPKDDGGKKYTFFHNAGWLGINYRKMTPSVIWAFNTMSRHLSDVTLFVHAQTGLEKMPQEIVKIVQENLRITYHVETVPAPGLYHKGRILVFPSKLEGLGLPLLEGMSCGLPAIATDAPPMNEFVKNGENGLLVKIAKTVIRKDDIAFPETIVDVNDLAQKMAVLAQDLKEINRLGNNARRFVEEKLNKRIFTLKANQIMADLFNQNFSQSHIDESLKLHIGCGNIYKKGYVNIDFFNSSVADRIMNATELDYPDNSVDLIESYHFIEHHPLKTGIKIMEEWYRVLKPNGRLVVECPNLDKWIEKYMEEIGSGKIAEWAPDPQDYEDWLVRMIFGINERGPDATHLCGYNSSRLENYLKNVGFREVKIGHGTDYHAEIAERDHGSPWFCLRAEAKK